MSCEEHDKLSAKSQFLAHTIGRYKLDSSNITEGGFKKVKNELTFFTYRVLGEMEIEPTPIDTKGFQKLVQVVY